MSRGPRIVLRIAASLTALFLILTVTAVLVLKSNWFLEKVRQRIVAALENGTVLFAEQESALNVKGENLKAQFSYDFTGPRYKGQLSIQPLEINTRDIAQPIDVYLELGLEKNRIDVSRAKLDMRESYI